MRSCSGTNFEPPSSAVARTKANIACFAGPSFHESNAIVCAWASAERGTLDIAGSNARPEISTRRLMPNNELLDFIFDLLCSARRSSDAQLRTAQTLLKEKMSVYAETAVCRYATEVPNALDP